METTAIVQGTGGAIRPSARCERNKAQPAKKRTHRANGNGFLSHYFQSVWGVEGNRERMVREYFNSLTNLCNYYGLPYPAVTGMAFPQNIYQSWKEIADKITGLDEHSHCMILEVENKRAVIGVVKTFNLNGLYYIPVRSYWRWSKCAEQQRVAELITVIFAYLHQVVEIPFYAENGSFMNGEYEVLEQWLSEAEDEGQDDAEEKQWREEREDTMYELRQAGNHILRLIQNPDYLNRMEEVVTGYQHRDNWELEWELLGVEFLQLYRQYPKRSLPDCIHTDLVYPDEDERISCYQYTGFHWSNKDCFADELDDMINCSFQEIAVMDEPTAVQLFDKMPTHLTTDFDFETRLFGLIERLRDLLDDYDHEEYNRTV